MNKPGRNAYNPRLRDTSDRYLDSHQHHQRARRRYLHTAVWTGSEMIVWGGFADVRSSFRTPAGDTIPARIVGQPPAPPTRPLPEYSHTAVWTGSEMIVWGGVDGNGLFEHWREIQSQHRQLDSHQHHQRARLPETSHTAVWTGSEMIVWGGANDSTRFEHRREIQSQH